MGFEKKNFSKKNSQLSEYPIKSWLKHNIITIVLGREPKYIKKESEISSFLAGNQKTKKGSEIICNSIIVLGGEPKY
jgi:hypothetical protein